MCLRKDPTWLLLPKGVGDYYAVTHGEHKEEKTCQKLLASNTSSVTQQEVKISHFTASQTFALCHFRRGILGFYLDFKGRVCYIEATKGRRGAAFIRLYDTRCIT